MEAEYVAASQAVKEAKWIKMFCDELSLGTYIKTPYILKCDNKAAISFSENRVEKSRTKHIDIAYHQLRDEITKGLLRMRYVPSMDNASDIFTKGLNRLAHQKCGKGLGLVATSEKAGDL